MCELQRFANCVHYVLLFEFVKTTTYFGVSVANMNWATMKGKCSDVCFSLENLAVI